MTDTHATALPDFTFDARDAAHRHYLHLPHTPRPRVAATQWLAFRFRSDGMFAASPGSHFAIVLRARLGIDATGTPSTISGRGITLGDTSLAQPPPGDPLANAPGFGGARGAQVESFWPGGNFLFADAQAAREGLRDGIDYRVVLHVDDARWIAFGLQPDDDTPLVPRIAVQDRAAHPVAADATGLLIVLGRGPEESGPWRVRFHDIATGWFATP